MRTAGLQDAKKNRVVPHSGHACFFPDVRAELMEQGRALDHAELGANVLNYLTARPGLSSAMKAAIPARSFSTKAESSSRITLQDLWRQQWPGTDAQANSRGAPRTPGVDRGLGSSLSGRRRFGRLILGCHVAFQLTNVCSQHREQGDGHSHVVHQTTATVLASLRQANSNRRRRMKFRP